jgi:hypothetical protein
LFLRTNNEHMGEAHGHAVCGAHAGLARRCHWPGLPPSVYRPWGSKRTTPTRLGCSGKVRKITSRA